ncbi:MAG: molybdopterin-dependent oxidoreductase [Nitriliruptorales bacterium]|nr:molybdopterin-dependent oxidoreductase [Nitriliruptorales bacterium]
MAASFGRGAMTNHWVDWKNSDVFLVIGANPAENHPCGWKWAHVARDTRGAKIIHVDPRFTRTSAVADLWAPIRAGTDTAFFAGLINYVLENELYHADYVRIHTNASFILAEDFEFDDGLFSGLDEEGRQYDTTTWDYERESGQPDSGGSGEQEDAEATQRESGQSRTGAPLGPTTTPGFARRDPSLQDERTVFQFLRRHYARYTPEKVSQVTGMPQDKFLEIAELMGSTGTAERVGNIVYAVGLTQHTQGLQMIRGLGVLQLLLGNVGRPGGGVNAERGHANIQGNTDNAQSWEILPGYLGVPQPGMQTIDEYVERSALAQLDPHAVNFFGANYRAFLVSLLKTWFGEAATEDNDYQYAWLPKPDKNWSWMTIHDEARAGRLHGLFNGGMSSVNIGPDSNRIIESLSNLRWFVVMDPLPTASSEFWQAPGVDPETVQTEVFFFPTTHWIEKAGAFVNSGRWVQWKHAALPPIGEIKHDNWILAQLFLRLRALYEEEGGAMPDPILNLTWDYADQNTPGAEELAKEINGRDLSTGEQLSSFGDLKDDGTTTSGNWIYVGCWTEDGNQMDRRGTDDPTGMGYYHNWTWSWPANRRVMYNRASADAEGNAWDPERPGIVWNGREWVGDVPDFAPDSDPADEQGAFIMTGEGYGRLFAPGALTRDGPVPEHYEPYESPIENLMSSTRRDPVAQLYEDAPASFAEDDSEYPYVATTYRVTEHEHYVTQHVPYLVEAMPDLFIELPVELAEEKGIANTDMVRVSSKRGEVVGMAMVSKRMRPLRIGQGKVVYQVGIPVHWHYAAGTGKGKAAQMANLLSPYVGDATVNTPEFKAFLVNVERA